MDFKPRILVIISEPSLSQLVTSTLQLMGADVCLVSSNNEASIQFENRKFDGVFIDWDSPELDPVETTRRIRGSKSNGKVPIAVLGGGLKSTQLGQGFRSGAVFFLAKPFGVPELTTLLNATRGMMVEERRRYQRVHLSVPALIQWGLERRPTSVTGRTVNISTSGMLLKVSPRPEQGIAAWTELRLPGEGAVLHLKGLVVRSGPADQVGMKLIQVGESERRRIESYVTTHAASSLFPA